MEAGGWGGKGRLRGLEDGIARRYVACQHDMEGRAPGEKTMEALMLMDGVVPYEGRRTDPVPWNRIPFNSKGGGCGGAMRAMCIGLRFPGPDNRKSLIEVAIESGRMTQLPPPAPPEISACIPLTLKNGRLKSDLQQPSRGLPRRSGLGAVYRIRDRGPPP